MTAVTPEVVRTGREAAGLSRPPLLVLDAVAEFLDRHGLGAGELTAERIGDGQSNVTFLLRRGETRLVLRRGPRPPFPPSAHDMVREARLQLELARRGFPVPRVLAVCEDDGPLGVPFYVMSHVEGLILLDRVPEALAAPRARRAAGEALVDALVRLHDLPIDGELARFGRPDGYLERQVRRFGGLWRLLGTRELPLAARLETWLGAHLPPSAGAAVVHGDYRAGNVMFDGRADGVAAVLDWEMSTLGDPLADLGYLVATYGDPDVAPTVMELSPVTREAGFPRRPDLVERYARATGRDVAGLDWFEALALWKSAAFCEAIYARWLAGERPDDRSFGPALADGVPELLERAREAAGI